MTHAGPSAAAGSPEPSLDPPPPPPPPDAPGLREQVGATRDAARRLASAHVELAKAELADIADELKRIAALVGLAIGVMIVAALIVTVGLPLFLGEWIFGSLGWGLLHGLLLMIGIAVAAGVLAIGLAGRLVAGSLVVAAIVGAIVGIALGLDLTNRGWALVGDRLVPAAAPDIRPLAAALVALPLVAGVLLGLLGAVQVVRSGEYSRPDRPAWSARFAVAAPGALYVGWLTAFGYAYATGTAWPAWVVAGAGFGGFVVALVVLGVVASWPVGGSLAGGFGAGAMLGVPIGALTAIALGPQVGAAIGLAVALAAWPAFMGAGLARQGVDGEALKARLVPQKSIDMTKETIEWARARMPLSRRS